MSSRSGDRGKGATGERARGRAVGRAKERAGVEGTRRSEGGRGARSPTRAQQSTTAANNFGSKTSGADRRRLRPEAERPRAAPRAPEGPLVQPGHRAGAPAVARAPTAATGVRRPRPCIKLRTIQVRTSKSKGSFKCTEAAKVGAPISSDLILVRRCNDFPHAQAKRSQPWGGEWNDIAIADCAAD